MRFVVTAGQPTPEEVAAITAMLLGHAAASGAADGTTPSRTPAWARAARFEGIGLAPFAGARDPRLGHRPTGALPPGAV